MVIAREIGYASDEFWHEDPIFFNQVAEAFYAKKKHEIAAFSPMRGLFR